MPRCSLVVRCPAADCLECTCYFMMKINVTEALAFYIVHGTHCPSHCAACAQVLTNLWFVVSRIPLMQALPRHYMCHTGYLSHFTAPHHSQGW